MRYLPSLLRRFYRPAPLTPPPFYSRESDPIARDLDAAVMEHERISVEAQERRPVVVDAIEDLLRRLAERGQVIPTHSSISRRR